MSNNNENQELYNNVLSITRDQLSKAMSLSTELEALLVIERNKNAELESRLAALLSSKAEPSEVESEEKKK